MVRLRKKYLETSNGLFTQRKLIIAAFRDIIGFSGVCWELGRYAWVFEDIVPITPIEAKGKLNIWNYN